MYSQHFTMQLLDLNGTYHLQDFWMVPALQLPLRGLECFQAPLFFPAYPDKCIGVQTSPHLQYNKHHCWFYKKQQKINHDKEMVTFPHMRSVFL